jgi:predicted AAA+ superfamily ATPase
LIVRDISENLKNSQNDGKVIIVLGARQVGKSTLLKTLANPTDSDVVWFNGDEPDVRERFANISSAMLRDVIGQHGTVVIDEAQRIFDIGITLKLLHDNFPEIKVFVSGSSSLELNGVLKEPLTGRKWEYQLFPFSYNELVKEFGMLEEQRVLEQRLLFGSYPDVVLSVPGKQRETLLQLVDSYLYKDIFALGGINRPTQFEQLLKALAFQVGSEVSYNELGQLTGLDNETVLKYIDLMEQSFLVFRLGAFSRNLRNEIKKSRKVYFHDNGVRNALMGNFSPLTTRTDVGALWENYLVSERMKMCHYERRHGSYYFWRTHTQAEIDYVEEYDGQLHAFEFKWNPKKATSFSRTFLNAYPDATTAFITPKNYHTFLIPSP